MEAASEDEVLGALAWAEGEGIQTVVLGGGSNVLIADRGIDALVLSVRISGIEVEARGERVVVRAGAGEPWDGFVEHAVRAGWAGLECLSGIPGDVGGTPIQNVGAYGQEVSETIVRVHAIDRRLGSRAVLDRAQCRFAYRDSAFKREDSGRFVVTAVTFELLPGGAPALRYPELVRHLGGRTPDLADVRAAVIELRRRKSMVIDPTDANRRSAGSFFMNPVLDADAARAVGERVRAAGVLEAMPEYPGGPGRTKLSAAWLIERAGFARGTHEGNVGISTRHTLALVNRGGATAAELVAFAARVRGTVRDRFGVSLVPEPVMLGFGPGELDALA